MLNGEHTEVRNALDGYIELCVETRSMHDTLMGLLPHDERERHETWFKAKIMFNDEFIAEIKVWVCQTEGTGDNNDEINPDDSVSNVGKCSNKSESCKRSSTTSSAQIIAAAEKAAIVARMAGLTERHALEEQELQLKRRKEQLDLETELADMMAAHCS